MSYGDELNKQSIQDHLMREALNQDAQKAVQDAASNAAPGVLGVLGVGFSLLGLAAKAFGVDVGE